MIQGLILPFSDRVGRECWTALPPQNLEMPHYHPRSFIQFMLDKDSYTWFAKLVAYGEFLIGVALILGAFVGIAVFFGALLNWNFIMAAWPAPMAYCSP
ncbi:MAG: hypothetical protein ACJ8CR_12520 [Roseiflexaceae bacterium]